MPRGRLRRRCSGRTRRIPVVIPGERITRPIVDYIRQAMAGGAYIPEATAASLEAVRVTIH